MIGYRKVGGLHFVKVGPLGLTFWWNKAWTLDALDMLVRLQGWVRWVG